MTNLPLHVVQQACRECPDPTRTVIIAAWLSLTRVYLEAECPVCGWTIATCFDLIKVDKWLGQCIDAPMPEGMQTCCPCVTAAPAPVATEQRASQ